MCKKAAGTAPIVAPMSELGKGDGRLAFEQMSNFPAVFKISLGKVAQSSLAEMAVDAETMASTTPLRSRRLDCRSLSW